MPESNVAATLKDVYDLVDRTRQETTSQISALATKFDVFAQANEHRLTIVETHQAAQAQTLTEISTRLDKHGADIGTLKDQQRIDEASAERQNRQWSRRNTAVATGASLVIAIGTVVTILMIH